jgi:hypothetical protein
MKTSVEMLGKKLLLAAPFIICIKHMQVSLSLFFFCLLFWLVHVIPVDKLFICFLV